jgi:hypothetical protein
MMAWPCNEMKRLLLLSSKREDYVRKICEFLYHLKLRGYSVSHLKRLRKQVIDHRYRREVVWESTNNKTNPFPIVIPYCQEIGRYNPTRIMELAKRKARVTNPMVKRWRFVSAWRRETNVSESLRIRHKELVRERKRKREELELVRMTKRTRLDMLVSVETGSRGVGDSGLVGRD